MIQIIFRGIAIGMTEVVPGVSGSTVAMILGIYERLLYALSMLTTKRKKEVFPFLFTLGVGMVIGFLIALYVINFLLENFRTPTLIFFVGIIVGFLPYLWKEARYYSETKFKMRHYFIMLLLLLLVIVGQLLGGLNEINLHNITTVDYLLLFTAGFVASIALVLPSISGALILTILGLYELATTSLMAMNIPIIIAIGSGVIMGVLFTSKIIKYILMKYPSETYVAMIGLVSGSIFAIYNNLDSEINSQIISSSAITFLIGFILVKVLVKNENKRIR
ncbi:DUF368 domain-containing protein [Saliterribacillus persicus]|uniref:Putative membrane protein n=1 Tax=Saliterribacillus persicus TaxID=930114 RepID=A0A368XIZ6_9BACI|nr:DUF368 domain-containing protein [Saliterribacillus persicus]RCW66998.1 putative membrane protein [Saliterribacillus persicus]